MDTVTLQDRLLARMNSRKAATATATTAATAASQASPAPRDPAAPMPLSSAQQRLWFLEQLSPGSPEYVMCQGWRLTGRLDGAALQQAFNALLARHESLRTRLVLDAQGDPVQVVDPVRTVKIAATDLSHLPASERLAAAHDLAEHEAGRPFALSAGDLMRVSLLRLGEEDHVLLLALHHILSDGWSLDVLTRDLRAFYIQARQEGPDESAGLPALSIQYADYAERQRRELSGETLAAHLDYWSTQLAGIEPLDLPTDRPRPAVRDAEGASVAFEVPAEVTRSLRRLATGHNASLYMTTLAAFYLTLSRWSGQNDIAIGALTAGRTRSELEDLIGFFVNTVVLRITPPPAENSDATTFTELLEHVRDTALAAFAHEELPFDKLVEHLAPERDLSRNPLIQVDFAFQEGTQERWTLPGLTIEEFDLADRGVRFDLSLSLSAAEDGGLRGDITFATQLFDCATMRRLAGHFGEVLARVAAEPATALDAIEILTAAERGQILGEFNDTALALSGPMTVHGLVAAQTARTPDALALVAADGELTYRELDERAERLARELATRGVGPQTLVAVAMERGTDLVVALLGILKAGAAYLPLDPDYPAQRLRFMIEDSRTALLISQPRVREGLADPGVPVLLLDASYWALNEDAETAEPIVSADPAGLAYMIYTSGSTGLPKGVQIQHGSAVNLLTDMARRVPITAADKLFAVTTISFDIALLELFGPLSQGATVLLAHGGLTRDPAAVVRELAAAGATVMQATPSLWRALVPEFIQSPDAAAGLRVLVGGEALPPDLAAQLAGLAAAVTNVYGPTETTVWSTAFAVAPGAPEVLIGRPIANTQTYVVDRRGALAPVGVPGELWIGGDGVARGYWERPELNAQRFVPDRFTPGADPRARRLYRTGDLVRWLPDGRLEFLGRIDHQVKLRGQRIELGEIEAVLARHPGVAAAVVVVREDTPGDQRLAAYLLPAPGGAAPDPAGLRTWVAQGLPAAMVPGTFTVLPGFPQTPNGKVDRKALPRPDGESVPTGSSYLAPRTELESVVAAVWSEVLGIERVGVHDDFFRLGGHSLLATRAINRVAALTGMRVGLRRFFEAPTVAAVARQLATAGDPAKALERRDPRPGEQLPLSFAQQRLWFLDQLDPGSPEYVMCYASRLRGPLDPAALESALSALTARHETLRTRFAVGADGDPAQSVEEPWTVEVPVTDLSALPEPDRLAAALARAEQESVRGFDLTADRLIRVSLLRLSAEDHVLIVALHHIIADGWSMAVLTDDLREYYRAALTGGGADAALPELPIQYADYAAWQRRRLAGPVLDEHLAYWRGQLAELEPLNLPTDRPRPAVRDPRGADASFRVSRETVQALRELSGRHNASLYMTTLAAFYLTLSRWSGQRDIAIGSQIAGRDLAELEGLVGLFVNTLVLRVAPEQADPTFVELVRHVRDTALAAYTHQELPFDKLVASLAPERDLSRNPLVQVSFAYQNFDGDSWNLEGTEAEPLGLDETQARFDLSLFLTETPDGALSGTVNFSARLFDEASMRRLAGHFGQILDQAASAPDQRLSAIDMLGEAERGELLERFAGAAAGGSELRGDATIHALFGERAGAHPEATALVFEGEELSYGELELRANRLAYHLIGEGLRPGEIVGVHLPRGFEMVVAVLGVLKAGAAFTMLDVEYPARTLAEVVDRVGARLVLHDRARAGRIETPGARQLDLDADAALIAEAPDTAPGVEVDPGAAAVVMFTSGSTGRPKGILTPHRAVTATVTGQAYARLDREAVWLQCAPVSWDAFLLELFTPLLNGGACVLQPGARPEPERIARLVPAHRINTLHLSASLLNVLIDEYPEVFADVTDLMTGGESPSPVHLARLLERNPRLRLVNGYSPAENTIFTLTHRVVPEDTRGAVPTGRPVLGKGAYVLDEQLRPVPPGLTGEVYMTGAGLAHGYLGQPGLSAERFVAAPHGAPGERMYRTGDLAKHTPDGTITLLGRADGQVKIRGFRVEPAEIEAVLGRHPELGAAVVVIREDEPGDKRLTAYCVPRPEAAPDPARLREWTALRLPAHLVPSWFVLLDALPITANGKLDRRALPRPGLSRPDSGERGYTAPRTEREAAAVAVWQEVLGLERVGVHDDFFELGGHSLHVVRAVNRMHRLGVQTSAKQVLQLRTIARIVEAGESRLGGDGVGQLAVELAGAQPAAPGAPAPRTVFFIHAGGGSVQWYLPLAERLAGRMRVVGIQAAGLDGREAPFEEVGPMAERYWAEIRAVQPEGRVLILGWSYGGMVAQEMARLRPEQVERAFLLEPAIIEHGVRDRLAEFEDGYRLAAQIWRDGQHAGGGARAEAERRLREAVTYLEVEEDEVSLEDWLPFDALGLLYRAAISHVTRPMTADAVLFVSDDVREATAGSDFSTADYAHFLGYWRDKCQADLRIVDVPCPHMKLVSAEAALDLVTREILGTVDA